MLAWGATLTYGGDLDDLRSALAVGGGRSSGKRVEREWEAKVA